MLPIDCNHHGKIWEANDVSSQVHIKSEEVFSKEILEEELSIPNDFETHGFVFQYEALMKQKKTILSYFFGYSVRVLSKDVNRGILCLKIWLSSLDLLSKVLLIIKNIDVRPWISISSIYTILIAYKEYLDGKLELLLNT